MINVFLIWTHGKEKLEEFLKDINNYHSNIKFTHEFNKENIPFLDLQVSLKDIWTTWNHGSKQEIILKI